MAAKHKREKLAFQRAQYFREILISRLNKCDSSLALATIEHDYTVNEQKGLYIVPILTAYHSALIKSQDLQIARLLKAKQEQFLVNTELAPSIEPTKESESIGSKNEVSPKACTENYSKTYSCNYDSKVPSEEPNTDNTTNHPDREDYLARVRTQIKLLENKKQYFESKLWVNAKANVPVEHDKYYSAFVALSNLLDSVEHLTSDYANKAIDLATFKMTAKTILNEKNSDVQILQTHRGCKEIVVNLLAAIIGNVLYLAAAACAGTFTLFKPATDTGNKVNDLLVEIINVKDNDDEDFNLSTLCHG